MKPLKTIALCPAVILCLGLHFLAADGKDKLPRRIVSLGPAVTDQLYLLGAGDRIVGVTTYCRPPTGDKKETVGTVVEASVEKVVFLKPDLVIAVSLTNRRQVEKLKRLGLTVAVFPYAKNFRGICDHFTKLGKIVGREERAGEVVRQARERLRSITERIKNLPRPKVFVQVGSRPLFSANKDSFIHDLVTLAGGVNIAKNSKVGMYSRERVIRDNPDCIIVVGMGIEGEKERKVWRRYKTLRAVRNNRIHTVDSYGICSPTPLTFAESLDKMAEILHPELETKDE